ncbi:hypothetical protein ACIRP0_23560 [Streptomyces sp. NPDC101733]|uniref:hypothetical protein n=1 Tax=unclassified Streptomyces TaxID=2593676 RepID=UPI00380DF03F
MCLRELRPSTGPYADCTKGEHQVAHRLPGIAPSAWRLASTLGVSPSEVGDCFLAAHRRLQANGTRP